MMGDRRADQGALFYEFCLERHVPQDHLLRAIDRFVNWKGCERTWLASTARSAVLQSTLSC